MSSTGYDLMRKVLIGSSQPMDVPAEIECLQRAIRARDDGEVSRAARRCIEQKTLPVGFIRRLLMQHGMDTRIVDEIQRERIAETPQPSSKGPGDHLHDVIAERTSLRPAAGCGCQAMRRKMNRWGADGCREHINEILDHMMGQRGRLRRWQRWILTVPGGKTVARQMAREMVEVAINRVEVQKSNTTGY